MVAHLYCRAVKFWLSTATRGLLALIGTVTLLTITTGTAAAATTEVARAAFAGFFTDALEFIVKNGDEIIAIAEALLEIFG